MASFINKMEGVDFESEPFIKHPLLQIVDHSTICRCCSFAGMMTSWAARDMSDDGFVYYAYIQAGSRQVLKLPVKSTISTQQYQWLNMPMQAEIAQQTIKIRARCYHPPSVPPSVPQIELL